jgi:hypothetical protein
VLLILTIDALIVTILVAVSKRKGLEAVLPYLFFIIILLPDECRIALPGLFDLRAQRVAIIVFAIVSLTSKRTNQWRSLPLRSLMIVTFVWVLASTCFSIVFMTSLKQGVAQVIEYYLLYYFVLRTITNRGTITKMLYAMVGAMSVCAIFGLMEIYFHWGVLSLFPPETQSIYGTLYQDLFDRGIRARSTFVHPIHFGAALAITIPFAIYLLSTHPQTWAKKMILNISILLMVWSLYKTGSRGPWLAAAIALLILTAAADAKLRKRMFRFGAVASLLLILRPGIGETFLNMYSATFNPESRMGSSFQYRPVLLQTVMSTLNADPLRAIFGYGLGSFREKGLVLEMPGVETHRWYTCDSTWILFWYETGYVGLTFFGALLLKPAFMALRSLRRLHKQDRCLRIAMISSLSAYYVVMMSVATYGWGQNGHMLWILFAMSSAHTLLPRATLRQSSTSSLKGSTWNEHRFVSSETSTLGEPVADEPFAQAALT